MESTANKFSSVLMELESALDSSQPAAPIEAPAAVLEMLAVLPALPEQVAAAGLPNGSSGVIGGPAALDLLERLADDDMVEIASASLPSTGKLFRMSARQRRAAIRWVEDHENRLQTRTWNETVAEARMVLEKARSSAAFPYPPVIESWCNLVSWDDREFRIAIADNLETAVNHALAAARVAKLPTSSDASTLLDASEPLAITLGGPVRVAHARSQRALELHYRRSSDSLLLKNYLERKELDSALKRLVSQDDFWALHYLGDGGVGKTMFLRYVDTVLARDLNLATARVDFDHLNPNYPLRAPGLLLLGFAEDLRLAAPESAVESFRKMSRFVSDVHHNLDEAQRSGQHVALGFGAPGFDHVMEAFVSALEQLHASGRRPVLILDTCEELLRLSSDNRLPETVLETFRILEALHKRFPPLRIVFSGRRPLASGGVGWQCLQEKLPPREYLMLCPILGFTREEAAQMLSNFRLPDPPRQVALEHRAEVLDLSSEVSSNQSARIEFLANGRGIASLDTTTQTKHRHNPYDLALYARWAASGDRDFPLTKLSGSKRHYYVRERIVGRLREDVARWLPSLTILERFDEDLIAEVTGIGESFPVLWAEIRGQEWIDIDRGGASVQEQVPLFFWNLDRRMRERLEAFYTDEMKDAWTQAQRRVLLVLETFTLERPWDALTPSYFAVCVRLLESEPDRAAAWWTKVEQRILIDDAWGWAEKITGILLGPESPALGTRNAPHPLQAPVSAMRANVILRQTPDQKQLQEAWQIVIDLADAYPSKEGADLLRLRGLAGWIGSWRYTSVPPSRNELRRRGEVVEQLLAFEALTAFDLADRKRGPQWIFTLRALAENLAEIFEANRAIELFLPAQALYSLAERTSSALEGQPFEIVNFSRVRSIAGAVFVQSEWRAQPAIDDDRAFDWIQPADLYARQILEWGRIFERQGIDLRGIERFCRLALEQAGPSVRNLDSDRMLSQALRLGGTDLVSSETMMRLIPSSLALGDLREECQAHKEVPPFYATAIQALAGSGSVDQALNLLQDARAQKLSKAVLRWLNGVSSYLNRRFRLAFVEANEFAVPELPANQRTDVAMFLTLAEAALEKVKSLNLSEGEANRLRDAASRLCFRLEIHLPETAFELGTVPKGWQPWFARFLLILDREGGRGDAHEQGSIREVLSAIYPHGRAPADIEFVLTPKTTKTPTWPGIVFGFVLVALFVWLLVWLTGKGITAATKAPSTWWKSAIALVCLSSIVSALPSLFRFSLGAYSKFISFEYTIRPKSDDNDAINVDRVMRLFSRWRFTFSVRSLDPFAGSEPYKIGSQRIGFSSPIRAMPGRFPTTIQVVSGQEGFAGPCWEAFIGMAGGSRPEFRSAYIFRRTAPISQGRVEPFYGEMRSLAVSTTRSIRFFASGAEWSSHHLDVLPDLPDESVGILVLQAEVEVASASVRFAVGGKRNTYSTPRNLARLFPNLRLCILMDLDRSAVTTRTPLDRISAARARTAAHELFLCGIPAVLTIPYLPVRTNLSDETLAIMAKAAARSDANACRRLQIAARDVQNLIYKKSGLSQTDSAELAYDVCYYAAEVVNLQIDDPNRGPYNPSDRITKARSA